METTGESLQKEKTRFGFARDLRNRRWENHQMYQNESMKKGRNHSWSEAYYVILRHEDVGLPMEVVPFLLINYTKAGGWILMCRVVLPTRIQPNASALWTADCCADDPKQASRSKCSAMAGSNHMTGIQLRTYFTCWKQNTPRISRKCRHLQWRPGRASPGKKTSQVMGL